MKTTGKPAIMFLPSLNKVLLLVISYHIISYHFFKCWWSMDTNSTGAVIRIPWIRASVKIFSF